MKETGCIPVLVMVLTCLSVEAQPRPPEPRFHFGTGFQASGCDRTRISAPLPGYPCASDFLVR